MGTGRPKWKRRISSASRQLKITALISLSEITTGLESHCLKQEHRKEKSHIYTSGGELRFKEAREGLCSCEAQGSSASLRAF